jgi:hypothetical protein
MMRKKIRLSERELLNLVNKIIREQDENPDDVPVGYKSGFDKEISAKNSFVISVENLLRSLKMAEINKYRTPGEIPFSGVNGQLEMFMKSIEEYAEEARTVSR